MFRKRNKGGRSFTPRTRLGLTKRPPRSYHPKNTGEELVHKLLVARAFKEVVGSKKYRPILEKIITNPGKDPIIRALAVRALARNRDRGTLDLLKDLLAKVRTQATTSGNYLEKRTVIDNLMQTINELENKLKKQAS